MAGPAARPFELILPRGQHRHDGCAVCRPNHQGPRGLHGATSGCQLVPAISERCRALRRLAIAAYLTKPVYSADLRRDRSLPSSPSHSRLRPLLSATSTAGSLAIILVSPDCPHPCSEDATSSPAGRVGPA